MVSYFGQVREWLYKEGILPLVLRKEDMPGYISPQEILEIMQKPCAPEEPSPFAKTLGSILRGEDPKRVDSSGREIAESELTGFAY